MVLDHHGPYLARRRPWARRSRSIAPWAS